MKLNYDCLRDVMLALEENLTISEDLEFNVLSLDELCNCDELKSYSNVDIFYALSNLDQCGFIEAMISSGDGCCDCIISDITYYGHEFLQSIKPEPVWNNVKQVGKKIGTLSIPIITEIASSVLTKMITG